MFEIHTEVKEKYMVKFRSVFKQIFLSDVQGRQDVLSIDHGLEVHV